MTPWLAEALGTALLVLIGPGAIMVDARLHGTLGAGGIATCFGVAVWLAASLFGRVSGAHINPAVTIGLVAARRLPGSRVPLYLAAQLAGAVAAAALLRAAFGDVAHVGATIPAVGEPAAFALEALMTFVLMLAVLFGAGWPRGGPALAGLTVGLCAWLGGPLTGASLNPARSFGPALLGGAWTAHWLYWLAPITGALAASGVVAWRPAAASRDALSAG